MAIFHPQCNLFTRPKTIQKKLTKGIYFFDRMIFQVIFPEDGTLNFHQFKSESLSRRLQGFPNRYVIHRIDPLSTLSFGRRLIGGLNYRVQCARNPRGTCSSIKYETLLNFPFHSTRVFCFEFLIKINFG